MRVPFVQIFQTNPDGSISPLMPVNLGPVTMSPGVAFSAGVSFGGVNVFEHLGKDIEVEHTPEGTVIIKAFYQ